MDAVFQFHFSLICAVFFIFSIKWKVQKDAFSDCPMKIHAFCKTGRLINGCWSFRKTSNASKTSVEKIVFWDGMSIFFIQEKAMQLKIWIRHEPAAKSLQKSSINLVKTVVQALMFFCPVSKMLEQELSPAWFSEVLVWSEKPYKLKHRITFLFRFKN